MPEVEITHYCSCGAKLKINMANRTTAEHNVLYASAQALVDAFEAMHRGVYDGDNGLCEHRPVTAKESAQIRNKLEYQRRAEARSKARRTPGSFSAEHRGGPKDKLIGCLRIEGGVIWECSHYHNTTGLARACARDYLKTNPGVGR